MSKSSLSEAISTGNIKSTGRKDLIKLIQQISYRSSVWQVFSDFVEMSAIAIANSVDFVHREKREETYLNTIARYDTKEQELFPQMLGSLIEAMDDAVAEGGPQDILGQVFHELELHNKWTGQFFTPAHICDMMGSMICGNEAQSAIQEKGYVFLNEPACGSGAMILGFAKGMMDKGKNYCKQFLVTAQDIDLKCVHMSYLQLSLYGIPAVVIHMNTLGKGDEWSRWYTPAYILDGWIWKQKCGMTDKRNLADEIIKRTQEPVYGAMRDVEALIAASSCTEMDTPEAETRICEQLSMFE